MSLISLSVSFFMLLTKKNLDTDHILFLLDGVTLENWYLPLQGQDALLDIFPSFALNGLLQILYT